MESTGLSDTQIDTKNQQPTHPIPSGQITIPKPIFSGILMGNVQLPLWLFYSQGPNMVTHQDDMTMDIFFRELEGDPELKLQDGSKNESL